MQSRDTPIASGCSSVRAIISLFMSAINVIVSAYLIQELAPEYHLISIETRFYECILLFQGGC